MIKFDPTKFDVLAVDTPQPVSGIFSIRADRAVALYVYKPTESDPLGDPVPVGVASTFDVEVGSNSNIKISHAQAGTGPVYIYRTQSLPVEIDEDEEVFTNIDQMPLEDGNVAAVQAAVRLFLLQQQEALAEIRREAVIAAGGDPDEEPDEDPEAMGEGSGA